MNPIAITYCNDVVDDLANRVKYSFEYFNKDVPFIIEKSHDEQFVDIYYGRYIYVGDYILRGYSPVLFFDYDTVIVSSVDELLCDDYDVAGSFGETSYYNTGVFGCSSIDFITDIWNCHLRNKDSNINVIDDFIFSSISTKYNVKYIEENCYYNEKSRKYWGKLLLKDNALYAPDKKQIKVLHWAGSRKPCEKYSCSVFNEKIKNFLNTVTGTTHFTTYSGLEFTDYLCNTYGREIIYETYAYD